MTERSAEKMPEVWVLYENVGCECCGQESCERREVVAIYSTEAAANVALTKHHPHRNFTIEPMQVESAG